ISASPTFFVFHAIATTEIYTLSLHDALPISAHREQEFQRIELTALQHQPVHGRQASVASCAVHERERLFHARQAVSWLLDTDVRDRKSTRLNSSHLVISYAVFCLKKKT